MKQDYPPIIKLAERIVLQLELTVRGFSRYNKYTLGTELRQQSQAMYRLAHRAWRDKSKQLEWLTQLVWAVDELKLSMQLAQQLRAFASFGQFEQLAKLVADMGKQTGGWHKQQVRGQKPLPSAATEARPQILSSPVTPEVQT
ncbi:MAG: four helix bundle protein [Pseudomonadales bacterium]|nr:four helix bundle protein [Pseudomonadales bacterium]